MSPQEVPRLYTKAHNLQTNILMWKSSSNRKAHSTFPSSIKFFTWIFKGAKLSHGLNVSHSFTLQFCCFELACIYSGSLYRGILMSQTRVFLYFVIFYQIMAESCQHWHTIEFFLNNTNLIVLVFFYKIDIEGVQNQHKIKLPHAGIQLTTPTIYGLEF